MRQNRRLPARLYFLRQVRQSPNVKCPIWWTACLLLPGACVFPSRAAFTSLYVFGDGVCTTTNNPSAGAYYYGKRYTNGRTWVEVLAERQGLLYDPDKNWSYFGHYSPNLVINVSNFTAPSDAQTALFVVWVDDADFVYDLSYYAPYASNNLAVWTNAINRSLTNHLKAVHTLYAKGARTLIMPNAVDLTEVPYYSGLSSANKRFVRQRIVDFNAAFRIAMSNAAASLSDLTIYTPDFFTLLDNLVAQPGDYGFTPCGKDALDDPSLTDKSLDGPGANYLFWDYLDPTAKAHAVMADLVQQLLSPVHFVNIVSLNGINRLEIGNIPIGRDGILELSANLTDWSPQEDFDSTNAVQSILVPATGSRQFYRLRFPFAWSWP